MKLYQIRQLKKPELQQIINLHLKVLKDSTLNKFGPDFLNLIYLSSLRCDNCIFLALKENGKIIGFALASLNINKFYSQIFKQNFLKVLLIVFKTFLKNPDLLWPTINWTLFHQTNKNYPSELQFLAIDEKFQRQGLGKKLLDELSKKFKEKNISNYKVGTWANSEISNNFYQKNGFKFLYSQKTLGENFNFYLSPKSK